MPSNEVYKENLMSRNFLERLAKQKAIIDLMVRQHKDEKAALEASMQPGWKSEIQTAFGGKLGSVSLSNPAKKLVIENMDVALADFDSADILLTFQNLERDFDEIVEVLRDHAPHLLMGIPEEEAFKEKQKQYEKQYSMTGKIPDGWELKESTKPRLTLRVNADAQEIAKGILQELVVPVLPEMRKKALGQ